MELIYHYEILDDYGIGFYPHLTIKEKCNKIKKYCPS